MTPEPASTELVPTHAEHRERVAMTVRPTASDQVLMPLDAGAVVAGMKAYQQLLGDLLEDSDWQETGETDKATGKKKRFPKKSAWRKIARAFNISFEIVARDVTYDSNGRPIRAETLARAVAPNGQYGDGDGYCALSEFTGKRASDPKLENTMRATATTRAKNRAIADLVGMGEVSAEELAAGGEGTEAAPVTLGPGASEQLETTTLRALSLLLDVGDGPEDGLAQAALTAIVMDCGDYLPRSVARAFALTGKTLKEALDARDEPGAAHPDATPQEPPAQQPTQTYGEPPAEQEAKPADPGAEQAAQAPSEPPSAPDAGSPQEPVTLCQQAYKGSKVAKCVKPKGHEGPHEAAGGSSWLGDGSDTTAGKQTVERAEAAAKKEAEQTAAAQAAAESISGEVLPAEDEPSAAEVNEAREAAGQDALDTGPTRADVGQSATDDIEF